MTPVCPKCGEKLTIGANAARQVLVSCLGWNCDFQVIAKDETIIRAVMDEQERDDA